MEGVEVGMRRYKDFDLARDTVSKKSTKIKYDAQAARQRISEREWTRLLIRCLDGRAHAF